jgi:hypothetical protein
MKSFDRREFLKNLLRSALVGGSIFGCAFLYFKNNGKAGVSGQPSTACSSCTLLADCKLPEAIRAKQARNSGCPTTKS